MNQIGASHITSADLLIVAGALFLYVRLLDLPPHGVLCRIVVLLTSCLIVAVMLAFFLTDNLRRSAVMELAGVAIWMCFGIEKWHQRARSTHRTIDPETSS